MRLVRLNVDDALELPGMVIPFPELVRIIHRHKQQLGPTGDFPKGRMNSADEGGVRVAIMNHDGKIVIDFGKALVWIGFDPVEARAVAAALLKHATDVEAGQ